MSLVFSSGVRLYDPANIVRFFIYGSVNNPRINVQSIHEELFTNSYFPVIDIEVISFIQCSWFFVNFNKSISWFHRGCIIIGTDIAQK